MFRWETFLCAESWVLLKKSVFFLSATFYLLDFWEWLSSVVFSSLQTSWKAVETSKNILTHLTNGPCWIVTWYAAGVTDVTTRPFRLNQLKQLLRKPVPCRTLLINRHLQAIRATVALQLQFWPLPPLLLLFSFNLANISRLLQDKQPFHVIVNRCMTFNVMWVDRDFVKRVNSK